ESYTLSLHDAPPILGDFISRGKTKEWELYRSVLKNLDRVGTLKVKCDVAFLETRDERIIQLFFMTGGNANLLCDPVDQSLKINRSEEHTSELQSREK